MTDNALALTTYNSPPWVEHLRDALRNVPKTDSGKAILPYGKGLTPNRREEARNLISSLSTILRGHPNEERARRNEMAKLVVAFSPGMMTEGVAELRMDAYLEAVEDLPVWAIKAARKAILAGEAGIPQDKLAWLPSPPQIVAAAKRAMEPAWKELGMLRVLVDSVEESPPLSPEERDMRVRRADELMATLRDALQPMERV